MKKKRIFVTMLLFMIAVFLIIGNSIASWCYFNYSHKWKYKADYENYATDFNCVKDYIVNTYPDVADAYLIITRSTAGVRGLYDPVLQDDVDCPTEVKNALTRLCRSAFPDKDSDLDIIRIHGARISFCIESGQYTLVYSPHEKPTWLNAPDENRDVAIQKADNDWYHIVFNQ